MKRSRTTVLLTLSIGLFAGASMSVAAQDPPDEFTGRWSFEDQILPDTEVDANGSLRITDGAWRYIAMEVTDPRFDGEVTVFSNWDDIETASGESIIRKTAWRVENANGSWQSDIVTNYHFLDGSAQIRTSTFAGEGGYDGLTAIIEVDQKDTFRGIITGSDLPPDPEPRSLP